MSNINLLKINSLTWKFINGNLETELNSVSYICKYKYNKWQLLKKDDITDFFYENDNNFIFLQAVIDDILVFVELLLKSPKVDDNTQYEQYKLGSALIEASREEKTDIVKLLLENTNICMYVNVQTTQRRSTALILASYFAHTDIVELLLKNTNNCVNVNIQDTSGNTALIYASEFGHTYVAKLILEYNKYNENNTRADVNIQSINGQSALIHASLNGNSDIVKLLLECNNLNVNIQDNEGNTALIRASIQKHNDIVRLLLKDTRTDINVKNKKGYKYKS